VNVLIEAPLGTTYCASMRSILLRLIMLVAVLLMPFGMSGASAAGHRDDAAASISMQYCPDQGSKSASKSGFAECTMACSAALPAADMPSEPLPQTFAAPVIVATAHVLIGLHPDTVTPPPKIA